MLRWEKIVSELHDAIRGRFLLDGPCIGRPRSRLEAVDPEALCGAVLQDSVYRFNNCNCVCGSAQVN